ncbi:MAG TPA: (Fe-S)-binding protein [Solirubrobacteraceae bacterium]|nr:(Fe-S)-binding protein [Solirubrobacteraceae bacterium]
MPAFDLHRPPDQTIIEDCVHCGFCLDACPTYALWAQEADSPRGRIVLIDEALNGASELSDEMVTHFDRCLGCMACVTACPSGVRYDRLIERVRPQVERLHSRRGSEHALRLLLFETLPHPKRLRRLVPLMAAARTLGFGRLPGSLGTLTRVAPRKPTREIRRAQILRARATAAGEQRGRVGMLLGCVQRVFYPEVHRATIAVLSAEGYEVIAPELPDCCGALEFHSGEEEAAIARARSTIAAFAELGELDHVIVNAAGCGSAMKEYGDLLGTPEAAEFSSRVRDISELLGSVQPRAPRGPVPLRVAYHDACHLAHAQGVRAQPRTLLNGIPELELLEVTTEPQICCGSAGIYNLVQPQAAADLGQRKARHVLETGAEAVAAGNPGCAAQLDLHLRRLGSPLPIHHPIELLWRSIEAVGGDALR